jgi:polysaccharide export outer membrane protein
MFRYVYEWRESPGMYPPGLPGTCLMLRKLLCVAVVVLAAGSTGCAAGNSLPRHAMLTPDQEATLGRDEYKIGTGDALEISVWKNSDISRTVVVRPDGMISLPLLNDIQAAGLSPMQLREVLSKKLKEYMPAPEVSVIVTEPRSAKVLITGEVQRPGSVDLRKPTTVLEALFLAGGLTNFASSKRITIMRPNGRTVQRIAFDYKKAMSAEGESENFLLQPGDIILVP